MKTCSLIVELIGPPGSGKTTLANILIKNDSRIEIVQSLDFSKINNIPFFASSLLMLIPHLLPILWENKQHCINLRNIAFMTIISGWHRIINKKKSSAVLIFDEGPIGMLARLHLSDHSFTQSNTGRKWFVSMQQRWSSILDVVVRFETPIPVLLDRIRSREKQYEIREMADETALDHLMQIELAQKYILSTLSCETELCNIVHVNTIDRNPEQIGNHLVVIFESQKYINN
jgi:deoxyadenosine/deoxycytidine kinase